MENHQTPKAPEIVQNLPRTAGPEIKLMLKT